MHANRTLVEVRRHARRMSGTSDHWLDACAPSSVVLSLVTTVRRMPRLNDTVKADAACSNSRSFWTARASWPLLPNWHTDRRCYA